MSDATKTPSLPAPHDARFNEAAKEIIEVGKGVRGNPLDSWVTLRDLIDNGTLTLDKNYSFQRDKKPSTSPNFPSNNQTVPPTPENVKAQGAMTTIVVSWDAPTYGNHAYAEIFRADINDVGQASKIGMAPGTMFADSVGAGATKYYWVRFVTTSDVVGLYSSVAMGKTALNPAYIMANLLSVRWQPNTFYSQFQYVRPTNDNGHLYRVSHDGVSGAQEPTWPTSNGQTIIDGAAEWVCVVATETVPFMIGKVNGKDVVVIDTAYIADAAITTAKIQSAFLDHLTATHGTLAFARIGKGNIFSIAVGDNSGQGEIMSSNFSPANNSGFIIRNVQALNNYIAEFYGDVLFSGDVRGARILGGLVFGSRFGVPSDYDGGTYEYLCYREVLSSSVNLYRKDSYLPIFVNVWNAPPSFNEAYRQYKTTRSYNGSSINLWMANYWGAPKDASSQPRYRVFKPFSGFSSSIQQNNGLPSLVFRNVDVSDNQKNTAFDFYKLASYRLPFLDTSRGEVRFIYNAMGVSCKVVSAKLNIIAYNSKSRLNYQRYKHKQVSAKITFKDSCLACAHDDIALRLKTENSGYSSDFNALFLGVRFRIKSSSGKVLRDYIYYEKETVGLSVLGEKSAMVANASSDFKVYVFGQSAITPPPYMDPILTNEVATTAYLYEDDAVKANLNYKYTNARSVINSNLVPENNVYVQNIIGGVVQVPELLLIYKITEGSTLDFKNIPFDDAGEDVTLVIEVEHVFYDGAFRFSPEYITSDPFLSKVYVAASFIPVGLDIDAEFSSTSDNTL